MDASHYSVVSAMITPAFFLTATAGLLASCNSRLARVVDRARLELARLVEEPQGPRRVELETRMAVSRRRCTLVLSALRLLYGALSAFVGTSLAIAVDALLGYRIAFMPTVLAVVGGLLMLAASVYLGREAHLGLRMLDREMDEEIARDRQPQAEARAD